MSLWEVVVWKVDWYSGSPKLCILLHAWYLHHRKTEVEMHCSEACSKPKAFVLLTTPIFKLLASSVLLLCIYAEPYCGPSVVSCDFHQSDADENRRYTVLFCLGDFDRLSFVYSLHRICRTYDWKLAYCVLRKKWRTDAGTENDLTLVHAFCLRIQTLFISRHILLSGHHNRHYLLFDFSMWGVRKKSTVCTFMILTIVNAPLQKSVYSNSESDEPSLTAIIISTKNRL